MRKHGILNLAAIAAAGGMGLLVTAKVASAASVVSYAATDAPGNSPDSGTTDVWTETDGAAASGTGSGSYYYTNTTPPIQWNANSWVIYSYPDPAPNAAPPVAPPSIDENHAFDSALGVGQMLSISFANSAVFAGHQVGISLTGTSTPITFSYTGGDAAGDYRYSDSTVTANPADAVLLDPGSGDTGKGFAYQTPFTVTFTLTSPTTYTGTAGTATWTGTYAGSITGIDVFNHAAGNGSDVAFNNLAISNVVPSPEPASLSLIGLAGAATLRRRRRGC